MYTIIDIKARSILDSRGWPTIEVDVILENGEIGRAAVPSGASTGTFEAVEKRDNDPKFFLGKGVNKAIATITQEILPSIAGMNANDQMAIDQQLCRLDGTNNKGNLGANATLGVSLAVARASAQSYEMPFYKYLGGISAQRLPMPLMNIINGGAHSSSGLEIQELMIVPTGASSFAHAMQIGSEVFHHLKQVLRAKSYSRDVGDEGGFAPAISETRQGLDLLLEAIQAAGYTPGRDVQLALDVAANEFYSNGKYDLEGQSMSTQDMVNWYSQLVAQYPIFSIEDPLAEEDWDAWQLLTQALGKKVQLVGDDLFVTNPERIARGISNSIANAVLIKPNQIGTLSETIEAIHLARSNGYNVIISHRSGETTDTTIADLAVAFNCGQIKTGAPCRGERVAKYNRLLQIAEELDSNAKFGICPKNY